MTSPFVRKKRRHDRQLVVTWIRSRNGIGRLALRTEIVSLMLSINHDPTVHVNAKENPSGTAKYSVYRQNAVMSLFDGNHRRWVRTGCVNQKMAVTQ